MMGNPAFINRRILWVPRSLRPYESSSSILAKAVYLARTISTTTFEEVFERLTNSAPSDIGPCQPKFSGDKFKELAGEQSRRVRLSVSSNLRLPGSISCGVPIEGAVEDRLWVCHTCISEGYHSQLHQFQWLKRCFVHRDALSHYGFSEGPQSELEMAKRLYAKWFGSGKDWPGAKHPIEWRQAKRTRYLRIVPELMRHIRATADWADERQVSVCAWPWPKPALDVQLSLLVRARLTARPRPAWRLLSVLNVSFDQFEQRPLPHWEVEAMWDFKPDDLERLAVDWFRQSLAADETPPQLLLLVDRINSLVEGHEKCFALLKQAAMRWRTIWPAKHDPGRSNSVLRRVMECGVESCAAIRLVEALSRARPSVDGLHLRQVAPWFEHVDLQAAIRAWLRSQQSANSAPASAIDSRLVGLLAALTCDLIGSTLFAEVFGIRKKLPKVDWSDLADATAGLGPNRPQYGADWWGLTPRNALLIKMDGLHWLLRESLFLLVKRDEPDTEHEENVLEACCAGEAASQLRWPTPGYVRSSDLPVPAARVERIMRMWGAGDVDIGQTLLPNPVLGMVQWESQDR